MPPKKDEKKGFDFTVPPTEEEYTQLQREYSQMKFHSDERSNKILVLESTVVELRAQLENSRAQVSMMEKQMLDNQMSMSQQMKHNQDTAKANQLKLQEEITQLKLKLEAVTEENELKEQNYNITITEKDEKIEYLSMKLQRNVDEFCEMLSNIHKKIDESSAVDLRFLSSQDNKPLLKELEEIARVEYHLRP